MSNENTPVEPGHTAPDMPPAPTYENLTTPPDYAAPVTPPYAAPAAPPYGAPPASSSYGPPPVFAYDSNNTYGATPTPYGEDPGKQLGIIALVVSLAGLLLPVSLIGAILGHVAMNKSKVAGFKNPTALSAVIVGWVLVALSVLSLILFFTIFAAAIAAGDYSTYSDSYSYETY